MVVFLDIIYVCFISLLEVEKDQLIVGEINFDGFKGQGWLYGKIVGGVMGIDYVEVV